MANIAYEELFIHPGLPGMIVVTTNGRIRKDGALVMGRGAALQAKTIIPGLEYEAGGVIQDTYGRGPWTFEYGFIVVREPTDKRVGVGLFQVKLVWSDPASITLISRAAVKLRTYALEHPDMKIRMNYPGIGNGRLERSEVEPFLRGLPDNVTICLR